MEKKEKYEMKTMIEIAKEIEKREGCPCKIEVTIVKPSKIEENKYGELEKRLITVGICKDYQEKILNEVLEKDKRNMKKVLSIVQAELPKTAGRYKSVKQLSKKLKKLEGSYSVLKNGIYWDTEIGHPGWYSIIKGPIARIEYELINKNNAKIVQRCYICGKDTGCVNILICDKCKMKKDKGEKHVTKK